MSLIHFNWVGTGWAIKPIFWIEDEPGLSFNDLLEIFSFRFQEIELSKKFNSIPYNFPKRGFQFSLHNLLDFFRQLKRIEHQDKFVISKDIEFWELFSKWCLSFLIRQEIIPYLIKTQKGLEARWIPVFKDEAYRDLLRFAKSIPEYAISQEDSSNVANSLLDICYVIVDALCRYCAFENGFRQEIEDLHSIHDLWLQALFNKEAQIRLQENIDQSSAIAPKDIDKFYEQILAWQAPFAEKSAISFKLLFRLTEPDTGSEDWKLECFLQAIDDPNIMLPISMVWRNPRDPLLISRGFINSKTTILAMLSRASKLFLPIKRQLIDPNRSFINLTTTEAYSFLKEGSWLLKEDGFSVLLPNWWRANTSIYKIHTRAKITSSHLKDSTISLNSLLDFNWYLAFEETPLSREELLYLSSVKQGLINLRGKWVEITPEDINKLIEYIISNKKGQISISKIIAASLGAKVHAANIVIDQVEVSGWLEKFLRELKGVKYRYQKSFKANLPKKFNGSLRDYQIEGFSWLYFMSKWGLGVCLADDMGLGKTVQVLALFEKYFEQGIMGPFLVISPTSVIGNWEKEISRFLPHISFYIHQGADRLTKEELKDILASKPIVITSYALLTRDFDRLKDINWLGVIVDEAQNIKNPFSKQFKYASSLKTRFRIALTGTPVENSLRDLWAIMDFLNLGILGSYEVFRRDFLIPIQLEDNKEVLQRLRSIISPFILRREKTDPNIGIELPEKNEQKIEVFLTDEQINLYKAVVEDVKIQLDTTEGIVKKGLILSTITKLKQICDHPSLFLKDGFKRIEGRSGKLEMLTKLLIDVLDNEESSLIFTQFSSMGQILKIYLSEIFNIEVLFIHGGLPRIKRDEIVRHFQNSNSPKILVLSLRASGTGLNLTKATHVFHYDRWWNPAVENQATDRAYRIGQTNNIKVYKFICKGTIEEKIESILKDKIHLAQNIITHGESWITKLSDKEVKDLFRFDN